MSAIDDPLEAVKQQHPEKPVSPISVMLDVLSPLHPFAEIVTVFRGFSSQAETNARVKALFDALEWYVRRHESKLEELTLEKQLQMPAAKEAVISAVREALFNPDVNKIQRFGAILGHNFITRAGETQWQNAAAYIRDLARLGDDDIRTLRMLHNVQRGMFVGADQTPDQVQFGATMERVLINAEREGMSREDVYSRCGRLTGFGLTLQMERPKAMAVQYVFRLTRHGKHLMDILLDGP